MLQDSFTRNSNSQSQVQLFPDLCHPAMAASLFNPLHSPQQLRPCIPHRSRTHRKLALLLALHTRRPHPSLSPLPLAPALLRLCRTFSPPYLATHITAVLEHSLEAICSAMTTSTGWVPSHRIKALRVEAYSYYPPYYMQNQYYGAPSPAGCREHGEKQSHAMQTMKKRVIELKKLCSRLEGEVDQSRIESPLRTGRVGRPSLDKFRRLRTRITSLSIVRRRERRG